MEQQITYRAYYDRPSDEAIEAFYSGMRRFWQPVLPAAGLADGELKSVELLEEKNWLRRDGMVKRRLGFPTDYWSRAAKVLRLPSGA